MPSVPRQPSSNYLTRRVNRRRCVRNYRPAYTTKKHQLFRKYKVFAKCTSRKKAERQKRLLLAYKYNKTFRQKVDAGHRARRMLARPNRVG